MSRRAVVYARISRDKKVGGEGLGVARQLADCRELAEKLGWIVVAEHTDNDLSAYSGKPRPGYRAVLAAVASGAADAVIAWHSDRLHRRPVELEEYIAVCEGRGVPTHCVKAGPLDLSTPSGRLVARQLGAVARYEVEHSIERQKAQKAQAAEAGKFRGGRRPFGYEPDGCTVRVSEADIVRDMAARVHRGESVRSIAAKLNAAGCRGTRGGEWTGASVRDVLLRARNAALIEHEGEVVGPAQWEPILDETTWRSVGRKLRDPARVRVHTHERRWLGSGLYVCGRCGAPARIGSAGVRKAHARPYYRCSGPSVHVSRVADLVDELVGRVVVARLQQPDAADLFRSWDGEDDPSVLQEEAGEVRRRLDELAETFAAGDITARQLSHGSEALRERLEKLEQRISECYRGSALDGLAGAPDAAEQWEVLPLGRKREIVDLLMSVTILPGKAGRKSGGTYFDPDTVRIEWKADA